MMYYIWIGAVITEPVKQLSEINFLKYLLVNSLRISTNELEIEELMSKYGGTYIRYTPNKFDSSAETNDAWRYNLMGVKLHGTENKTVFSDPRCVRIDSHLEGKTVSLAKDMSTSESYLNIITPVCNFVQTNLVPDMRAYALFHELNLSH